MNAKSLLQHAPSLCQANYYIALSYLELDVKCATLRSNKDSYCHCINVHRVLFTQLTKCVYKQFGKICLPSKFNGFVQFVTCANMNCVLEACSEEFPLWKKLNRQTISSRKMICPFLIWCVLLTGVSKYTSVYTHLCLAIE